MTPSDNDTLQVPNLKSIDMSSMYSGYTTAKSATTTDDKDALYLFHIERQLNENISLISLFKNVQY